MKVKDFKKLLEKADDDMEVVVEVTYDRKSGRISIEEDFCSISYNQVVLDIDCC